jgi:hypothetical protein
VIKYTVLAIVADVGPRGDNPLFVIDFGNREFDVDMAVQGWTRRSLSPTSSKVAQVPIVRQDNFFGFSQA